MTKRLFTYLGLALLGYGLLWTGLGLGVPPTPTAAPVAAPLVSITDVTVIEGDSGPTPAVFQVQVTGSLTQPITLTYATFTGTALTPADYTPISGTLVFTEGLLTKPLSVDVLGDLTPEPDERFELALALADGSGPANLVKSKAVGRILDDDSPLELSLAGPLTVTEKLDPRAIYSLTLQGPITQSLVVSYTLLPGTALPNFDYGKPSPAALSFSPQAPPTSTQILTFTVPISDDLIYEANQTFQVRLTNPVTLTAGVAPITTTIVDNEARPLLQIGKAAPVQEGNSGTTLATFPVTLTVQTALPVTVTYVTSDGLGLGGAKAPEDYLAALSNAALVFQPGQITRTLTITVNGDRKIEPDETFQVSLRKPHNAGLDPARSVAQGVILNDDLQARIYLPVVCQGCGSAAPQPIFSDPFDADQHWQVVANTGASGQWAPGLYYLTNTTARNVRSIAPLSRADMPGSYTVEATAWRTAGASNLTEVGLLFDWASTTDFHRFLIYPGPIGANDSANWWVEKWNDSTNQWDAIASGLDKSHIQADTEKNHIKVVRNGNALSVYVNDFLLWSGKDYDYASRGQVGLIVNPHTTTLPAGEYVQGAFDDFIVYDYNDLLP